MRLEASAERAAAPQSPCLDCAAPAAYSARPFSVRFLRRCHHETDISAEQSAPRAHARIPRTDGNAERSQSACAAPLQGPQATDSVRDRLTQRLTFTAAQRLLKAAQFERAYAQGRRFGDALFSINVSAAETGRPRLGLSVGARNIANAVARNRVRRTVRESFREHQHELPLVDMVVAARAGARGVANAQLRASLAALWKRIAKECAASSRS